MTDSARRESTASKAGRYVALPFKLEAKLWHAIQPNAGVGLTLLKWGVRCVVAFSLGYYALPYLMILVTGVVVWVAMVAVLPGAGGTNGSSGNAFSLIGDEQPGVRNGVHGYGRYDSFGNREYDN